MEEKLPIALNVNVLPPPHLTGGFGKGIREGGIANVLRQTDCCKRMVGKYEKRMTFGMHKVYVLCLMLAVMMLSLISHKTGYAQQSCSTALVAPDDSTMTVDFDSGQAAVWIKHTPDSSAFRLFFFADNDFSGFERIDVYTGECSNLVLSDQMNEIDSSVVIEMLNFTADYFIRVERADTSQQESMFVLNSLPFTPHTTQPTGCNLVANPDFETLNPAATTWATNPNNSIGPRTIENNIITDWQVAWGTPNISPTGTWDPNQNHSCYLWAEYNPFSQTYYGEGIFQDIDGLIHGNRYKLLLDLRDGGKDYTPELRAEFTSSFTPNIHHTLATSLKPFYTLLYDITNGNGVLPGLSTNNFLPYDYSFMFNDNMRIHSGTSMARLVLYNITTGNQGTSALVFNEVRIEPDEEILITTTTINTCDVQLEASLTGNYQNVQYTWATATNNGTGNTVQFQPQDLPTTVTFTATYHDGCVAEESILVPKHIIPFTIDPVALCFSGDPVSITLMTQNHIPISASLPFALVHWDDPNQNLNNPQIAEPVFTASAIGSYPLELYITDAYGCIYIGSITVHVVDENWEAPEVTGTRSICDASKVIYEYSVVNPDPDVIYTWTLNAGQWDVSIVNSNNDVVELEIITLPSLPDHIELIVTGNAGTDCEKYFVYRIYDCCYSGDTALNDAVLNQSMLQNHNSILLQGVTEIHASLNLTNINVLMGPEARIVVFPGVNLSIDLNTPVTTDMIHHGCEVMWDGIYITDPTSSVEIENTTVKDAINAIVSKNGGAFSIENTIFEDNYISIDVMDYHADIPGFSFQSFPGEVTGTSFRSSTPSTYQLIWAPMAGVPVLCGIKANMVDDLTIGNHQQGSGQNVFENMRYGILGFNAHLRCFNSRFENIRSATYPQHLPSPSSLKLPFTGSAAIYSHFIFGLNSTFPISDRTLEVGTSLPAGFSNEFEDCNNAVIAVNSKVIAANNEINQMDNEGIRVINALNATEIVENELSNMSCGIRVSNTFTNANSVNIKDNSISDVFTGIRTYNIGLYNPWIAPNPSSYYLRIHNNTIFPTGGGNGIRTGINVHRCPYAQIGCNYIALPGAPSPSEKESFRGIWSSMNQHAAIYENQTNNMGCAIYTTGIQTNTSYFCNVLQGGEHAFFFGPSTLLTNQGSPTGSIFPWNTHNYFNQSVRLETEQGNIVSPPIFWYYFTNQGNEYMPETSNSSPYLVNAVFEMPNDGLDVHHFCGVNPWPNCPPANHVVPVHSTLNADERDRLYSDILLAEEIYLQYNEEYRQYNAEYLLAVLMSDSTLMFLGGDLDGEYQAFYDSLRNEPTSAFMEVEMLYNLGEWHEAWCVNQSITPTTAIEEYRQTVNNIFFSTWCQGIYTFSPEDSATLWDIALLTPYEGGFGVYTARVMLGIDPEDHQVAYRKPVPEVFLKQEWVKIYPNPARNNITIEIDDDIELSGCIIELYTIQGQKAITSSIKNRLETFSVGTVAEGLYFYRVINGNKILGSGKLIIKR